MRSDVALCCFCGPCFCPLARVPGESSMKGNPGIVRVVESLARVSSLTLFLISANLADLFSLSRPSEGMKPCRYRSKFFCYYLRREGRRRRQHFARKKKGARWPGMRNYCPRYQRSFRGEQKRASHSDCYSGSG